MGLPALATLAELQNVIGGTVDNDIQAQARLEHASAIVRAYAKRTWVNDQDELADVPDGISGVVCMMVERTIQNPQGLTYEVVGPFARSFGADSAQRLFLTAADKLVINNAIGRTGIGTISTTRGPLETPHVVGPDGCLDPIRFPDYFIP